MRITRDQMLLEMAVTASKRGTCLRLQVGAVIARDGRPLCLGYVGAPSGMPHCTPETCSLEIPCTRTIHAETNAVAWAAREGIKLRGASMYCTTSPCETCAKLLINTGIERFIYLSEYRLKEPVLMLRKSGILCYQYDTTYDES